MKAAWFSPVRGAFGESARRFSGAFLRDHQFHLALAAAPLFLLALSLVLPEWDEQVRLGWTIVLAAVLWQPFVEELLFRGFLQGYLQGWFARLSGARLMVAGVDLANIVTSALFALAHLVHSPPLWAAAVFFPSLVFGHFRRRHGSVVPSILLHAFYNACFFAAAALT